MCIRRVPLETEGPARRTDGSKPGSCGDKGKPQNLQAEPKTRNLPPVLEACLGFVKGTFGVRN